MGAVATVLSAFARIWALPEHAEHLLFSQKWEAQFCFRQYLCSLSGRLFFKYPTPPDAVITFTLNAARCWRHCRCWGWSLNALLILRIRSKNSWGNFVFITELVLSSVLAVGEVCLIKSCASSLSFNQSLKSRSVGLTQCFLIVKSDPDSLRMGLKILQSRVKKWGALNVWVIRKWFKDPNKTWNCCRLLYDVITIMHL